jgi:hypothetical protein
LTVVGAAQAAVGLGLAAWTVVAGLKARSKLGGGRRLAA